MSGVEVMKMPFDQIILVVAVGHGFVAAAWAVAMGLVVSVALVIGGARRRIRGAHRDRVLLHPRSLLVVKVPVVEIVLMPIVLDTSVAAVGAVNVRVAAARMLGLRLWRHVPSGW
jgi:ABC-type amino acid transport system permease subunit